MCNVHEIIIIIIIIRLNEYDIYVYIIHIICTRKKHVNRPIAYVGSYCALTDRININNRSTGSDVGVIDHSRTIN